MKLYDSLSKKITEFKPLSEDGTVKMYSCGPTVYSYPHIGNMRAYIFMDTLKRVLEYNHYKVINVMNITDVGHLTSDEDTGDDKMELAAKREQKNVKEIAEYYTKIFLENLNKLNIKMPTYLTKATDHINEIINFVKVLEEKGFTYQINDGVYFDISKFANYGQLSNMKLEDKLAGARVELNEEKKNPQDFALWKFVDKNHIMKWDSPWGVGCPGWHIECSAMSTKYLGDQFDIHTGGIDHLTIHHENEIAQNDCALGHKVVQRWMHCEFLQIDGGKMGKSLNNCYTIKDLEDKGFTALDLRYFALQTSYRKTLNFTFPALESAKIALARLKNLVNTNKDVKHSLSAEDIAKLTKYVNEFSDAINDDLNIPSAIGVLWNMLKDMPKSEDVYDVVMDFDKVLALDLDKIIEEKKLEIPQEIINLAKKRIEAKKQKNYALADELRNSISKQGYKIMDTSNGYEISKL